MAEYCMDCEHYVPGGVCGKTGKITGALREMCITERPKIEKDVKYCRKCGRTLPIEMFALKRKSNDGKQPYCRECSRAAYQKWHDKNIKV